jgi:hypothetical protein
MLHHSRREFHPTGEQIQCFAQQRVAPCPTGPLQLQSFVSALLTPLQPLIMRLLLCRDAHGNQHPDPDGVDSSLAHHSFYHPVVVAVVVAVAVAVAVAVVVVVA